MHALLTLCAYLFGKQGQELESAGCSCRRTRVCFRTEHADEYVSIGNLRGSYGIRRKRSFLPLVTEKCVSGPWEMIRLLNQPAPAEDSR